MFETSQKSYCWTPTKCSFAGKRLSQFAHLFISGQPVLYNHAACSPGFERGCEKHLPQILPIVVLIRGFPNSNGTTVRWRWKILRRSHARKCWGLFCVHFFTCRDGQHLLNARKFVTWKTSPNLDLHVRCLEKEKKLFSQMVVWWWFTVVQSKESMPGDSECPFHPLVGGHLTPWKGHLTIPKRSLLNHQVQANYLTGFFDRSFPS